MTQNKSNRLNVLQYICPTGYYGAERWIVALARNINADTVRCDLFVPIDESSNCSELIESYPQSAGKVITVESSSRVDVGLVKRLVAVIKERNIHVLHTHGYKSDITGLIAARLAGIPCVSTPHGFGQIKDIKLKAYTLLGNVALRYFNAVVPLSPNLLNIFERSLVIRNSRLKYIANGVDTTEIDQFRSTSKNENTKVNTEVEMRYSADEISIGYVGRLADGKELDQLIDAFNEVWLKYPNSRLNLVGDGPLREQLEEQSDRLACKQNVSFAGFQADRFRYLANLDVFVMTSVSEGIPRSMMEAMALEVAVVAYDIPGVDQLITHEKTGLLAPFGDKSKLSDNIKLMRENPKLRRELAKAGRARIETSYSAKAMAESYTELFSELTGRTNP